MYYPILKIFCFIIVFVLIGCKPCAPSEFVPLTDGHYVKGTVLVPATKNLKNGIIKLEEDTQTLHPKLQGLIYQFERKVIPIYSEVYYKVAEMNGVILAYDVKSQLASSDTLYTGHKSTSLAGLDLHTESTSTGKHNKIHMIRPAANSNWTEHPKDSTIYSIQGLIVKKGIVTEKTITFNLTKAEIDTMSSEELELHYWLENHDNNNGIEVSRLNLQHTHKWQ